VITARTTTKTTTTTKSDKEVMLIDRMGSICSSAKNNNNNASLPPKDLGELLQQAEKAGGSSPWLSEFETFLGKMDNDNLARATVPKLPQQQPPLQTLDNNSLLKASQQQPLPPIQGGQDPQQKLQPTSESQQDQTQLIRSETEKNWSIPCHIGRIQMLEEG